MFCVILTSSGRLIDCKEYDSIKEAEKEYKRQVRNAWRRKSAFCQVQYHGPSFSDTLERMQWRQKDGAYNLELTIGRPGWVDCLAEMSKGAGA